MIALKILLYFFSSALILMVALPLIKSDFWLFRIFDYPRMQKFVLILIVMAGWFASGPPFSTAAYIFMVLLALSSLYLAYLIIPYTPVGKKMIGPPAPSEAGQTLTILTANVRQDNRDSKRLLKLIAEKKPDMVFLIETDQWWIDQVKELEKTFPYHIQVPQENTYGLAFFSKIGLTEQHVRHLIEDDVPSIEVVADFHGQPIRIFGLHPTPPVPGQNRYSTERDAEILMVGKKVESETLPCMVIGDLNDVAWSYTTELFLKTSGLLDPRRGRGRFSTFHAQYALMRWPLDHYFVSRHFRLVDINVEKSIGSDHFPISISLALAVCEASGTRDN